MTTKAKQQAIDEAKVRLRETIGISERDAQRYTNAKRAADEMHSRARQHYFAMRAALLDAETAKGDTLSSDEIAEISRAHPSPVAGEDRAKIERALQRAEKVIARKREITCILRHVSGSGMSRRISLHVIRDDEHRHLSYNAAIATGNRYHDRDGAVIIGGCGMDMGFALVYDLSHTLYGDGYVLRHRWL